MGRSRELPLRFFVVTFAWSWVVWAPLVLAGLGVFRLDEGLATLLTMPAPMLGAFGPAVGACVAVWTLEGQWGSVRVVRTRPDVRA